MEMDNEFVLWGLSGCNLEEFEHEDIDTLFCMMDVNDEENNDYLDENGYFDTYTEEDFICATIKEGSKTAVNIINNLKFINNEMKVAIDVIKEEYCDLIEDVYYCNSYSVSKAMREIAGYETKKVYHIRLEDANLIVLEMDKNDVQKMGVIT